MKEILNKIKTNSGLHNNIKHDLNNIMILIESFNNIELDDSINERINELLYSLNDNKRIEKNIQSQLENNDNDSNLNEILHFSNLQITNKINDENEELINIIDGILVDTLISIDSNINVEITFNGFDHFIDINYERYISFNDTNIVLMKEQIEEIILNNIDIDR